MTSVEYLMSKKITPVIRIVAGSNKAEAFVTMTIEQFEEYGKHCAEKLLPTDEEIVKEANEIGEKESWQIGRQTGFIFGAKWMRDLIQEKSKK